MFTIPRARALLAGLMPTIAEFIEIRADAAELSRALTPGAPPSSLGGPAELVRLRARLDDAVREIQGSGAELKGFAPLLLDFPATFEGEPVLLCWLEGDLGLSWYHRADLGFPGRRPLPFDA
jgi:hypothetical protein